MSTSTLLNARTLFSKNQWPELVSVCKAIIQHNPDQNEAKYMMGVGLIQTHQYVEGIEQLKQVITATPKDANALNAIAIGYEKTHNFELALEFYSRALQLVPGSIPLMANIADLYRKTGKTEQAINQLKSILKTHPDDINTLNSIAVAYSDLSNFNQAKKYLEKALRIQPKNAQITNNLSVLLYKTNHFETALAQAKKAYHLAPSNPGILNNYGNCLAANNQPEAAIPLFLQSIQLAPGYVEPIQNLAYAYHNIGDFESAFNYYQLALNTDPNNKFPIWQRAMSNLLSGHFEQGWRDYEMGLILKERQKKSDIRPVWSPDVSPDAKVLVTLEQGVGDQVMFASCLPDLIEKTSAIRLECEPRLASLFERSFPDIDVIPLSNPDVITPAIDKNQLEYQVAIGSLPHYFRNKLSDFPRKKSFLKADPEAIKKWSERFHTLDKGLKIGISWKAGVLVEHKKRTIPLDIWLPILKTQNCEFINLQYGINKNSKELKWLEKKHKIKIHEWNDSDSYKNLDDFAAKIAALDLVISVGNANVHLAGALGTPTWCLIPYVPSWRWMFNKSESVWYQSVKIYRQPGLNQWAPVIDIVKNDLQQLLEKARQQDL